MAQIMINMDEIAENVEKYVLNEIMIDGEPLGKLIDSREIAYVIRCKNCKHFDGYYCHNKWWGDGHGNYTPPIKKEDGFCDWADRREE